MLYNELSLIEKILKDPINLVQYHLYSMHSNAGRTGKYKTKFCYRVVVDSDFNLTIDPEQFINENILINSYAVLYKRCPQDTSNTREYYFGDMNVSMHSSTKKPKVSKEEFFENLKTPLRCGFDIPGYISKFKEKVSQDAFIQSLWDFICEKMSELTCKDDGKKLSDIFIHFDFSIPLKVNNWHELPGCIDVMDDMHIDNLKDKALQYNKDMDVYALTKSLLPMVASGDDSNDIQFPGFDLDNRYKSFCLSFKDLRTILYHAKIMKALNIPLLKTKPYSFQIVPSGSYPTADLIVFMDRIEALRLNMFKKSEGDVAADLEVAEESIASTLDTNEFLGDPATFFNQILTNVPKGMTSFDIIMVQDGGNVMTIVSEINNISRSSLIKNLKIINEKATTIQNIYKLKNKPNLVNSFYTIHKTVKKGEKYQQKYIKFLMATIRGMYYGDPSLVNIYLDNSFKNIRADEDTDNFFMKIAFDFIDSLNKKGPYMPQKHSSSLGQLCAVLACPVTFVIKSFYKGDIGNLKRRVTKIEDVKKFSTYLMERLDHHDGDHYGKGKVIHNDSLSINLKKIEDIILEMEQNDIKFDTVSFLFSFRTKLGVERFFSNKE